MCWAEQRESPWPPSTCYRLPLSQPPFLPLLLLGFSLSLFHLVLTPLTESRVLKRRCRYSGALVSCSLVASFSWGHRAMSVTTLHPAISLSGDECPIIVYASAESLGLSKSPKRGATEEGKNLGYPETSEWRVAGGGEQGEWWGATDQEVEAVLDLLEAVNVLCPGYSCGSRGKGSIHRSSQDNPTPLPWPLALTPMLLILFYPKFPLLLKAGLCLNLLQFSHEELNVP